MYWPFDSSFHFDVSKSPRAFHRYSPASKGKPFSRTMKIFQRYRAPCLGDGCFAKCSPTAAISRICFGQKAILIIVHRRSLMFPTRVARRFIWELDLQKGTVHGETNLNWAGRKFSAAINSTTELLGPDWSKQHTAVYFHIQMSCYFAACWFIMFPVSY